MIRDQLNRKVWKEFPERMMSAGLNVWSLIILVILISLAINYLTSILFDVLWEYPYCLNQYLNFSSSQWWQLIISLAIIFFGLGFGLYSSYADVSFISTIIDVIIPFHTKGDKIEIGLIRKYDPSNYMRTVFSRTIGLKDKKEDYDEFRDSFGNTEGKSCQIHGIALTRVYELLYFCIIAALKKHGEKGLGKSKEFYTGGDFYKYQKSKNIKIKNIAKGSLISENYFFSTKSDFQIESITLPEQVTIKIRKLPKSGFIKQHDAGQIYAVILKSKFGKVRIVPSQIWSNVKHTSQAGNILQKSLPQESGWNSLGIIISVQLSAKFRRAPFILFFNREKYFQMCRWLVAELFENFDRELNWNRFIETDIERKAVKIFDEIQKLKNELTDKK